MRGYNKKKHSLRIYKHPAAENRRQVDETSMQIFGHLKIFKHSAKDPHSLFVDKIKDVFAGICWLTGSLFLESKRKRVILFF